MIAPTNIKIEAAWEGLKSTHRFRVGAVVYRGHKILGKGYNKPEKTHPKARTPFNRIHAEFDAILGIPKEKLKGASIYVHRWTRNGTYALAKPCVFCEAMLKAVGIKHIGYSE